MCYIKYHVSSVENAYYPVLLPTGASYFRKCCSRYVLGRFKLYLYYVNNIVYRRYATRILFQTMCVTFPRLTNKCMPQSFAYSLFVRFLVYSVPILQLFDRQQVGTNTGSRTEARPTNHVARRTRCQKLSSSAWPSAANLVQQARLASMPLRAGQTLRLGS